MSEKVNARSAWVFCAWPGLAQLWKKGAVAGLVLAIGFALLLNLALVASFGWTDVLSASSRTVTWIVVLLVWSAAGVASFVQMRKEVAKETSKHINASSEDSDVAEEDDLLFVEATNEYLQGNWYEVERLLNELLRRDPGDVEARLMWATMCRHTQRFEEARRRLDDLSLRERAEAWSIEIENERRLIEQEYERDQELVEDPNATIDSAQTNTAA